MRASRAIDTDRTLRTAAWWYVVPRKVIAFLILATLGLAAFLMFMQFAFVILRRLGA